jgi:aminoglycoside 3-N-acetyltransferase
MKLQFKRIISKIYSSSPYPEIFIRKIYWYPFFHKILVNLNMQIKKKYRKKMNKSANIKGLNSKLLVEGLKSLNIKNGDILLVHSSMDGLQGTSLQPNDVLQNLREIVGEEGTIVMPCFQKFKKSETSNSSVSENESSDDVLEYRYRDYICWTGLLNSIFLMQPYTIRSYFPNNSLAAQGPHAKAMMEHNLEGDLPHGKNSAWEYCVNKHAKVLFLGLKADHCFTLIHTVEDILDEQWPVKNWYKKQKYKIIDGDKERIITIRQRKLEWAKYLTEKYGTNEIRKAGLLNTYEFGGVTVEYIDDVNVFFNYLKDKVLYHNDLVFFKVPSKFLKKIEVKK